MTIELLVRLIRWMLTLILIAALWQWEWALKLFVTIHVVALEIITCAREKRR